MNKLVGKAPTGDWVMPDDAILVWLGRFIMAWSAIEATIEVAIAKELQVGPLAGSIVTGGLQAKARLDILDCLLRRDQEKNKEALALLKEIRKIGDRNDVLHSVVGGNKSAIGFNRRKANEKFTSKIERYDAKRFADVTKRCADLAADLMRCAGISAADYKSFFQEAHNAVNSD